MKKLKASLKSSQIVPLLTLIGYPLLIMIVLGWFVIPELKWYVKEIVAIALATLVVSTFVLFFSSVKIKKIVAAIAITMISFAVFIKLSFYYHFSVAIGATDLYVLFDSDQFGSSVFSQGYFSVEIFGLIAILVVPAILVFGFFLRSKRFNPFKPTFKTPKQYVLGFLIVVVLGALINWKFQKENLILLGITAYSQYGQSVRASVQVAPTSMVFGGTKCI